jgi:hypothetical protein
MREFKWDSTVVSGSPSVNTFTASATTMRIKSRATVEEIFIRSASHIKRGPWHTSI